MKISKMISLCKQNKTICLFNTERKQWLSDGCAVFPMYNLPKFDENSICRTYDITEKQQNKIDFKINNGLPAQFDFDDNIDDEVLIESGEITIYYGGKTLIPYMTSQGIAFIDGKYLTVLSDVEDGMLELYERTDTSGRMYFAIKSGFMLSGIVMPVDVVNEQFVDRLKTLTQQCEIALFNNKPEADRQQGMEMEA